MKTKEKGEKEFDAIKMTRDIKAKISREINGMNIEELQAYFAERSARLYSGSQFVNAAPDVPDTHEN